MKKVALFLMIGLVFSAMAAIGAQPNQLAGSTITFACMNDPFANVIRDHLIPLFEQETGIKVRMDIIPYTGLREKTLSDLVSGAGTYDVLTMDIVWMGEWAENDFVVCLDPLIARDGVDMRRFLPGALDGLAYWKGKIYGLPIGAYYFIMHYRKDLFEEAGLPAPVTFDDVLRAGQVISELEDNLYGIAEPMVRGAPIVHYFLAFLSGAGGMLLDSNYTPRLTDPVAEEVLGYYKQFLRIGPPGMLSYDWFNTSDAFQQGLVGMVGCWSVVSPGFEDPAQSVVAGKVGYTALPVVTSGDEGKVPFGGWSLAINKHSRNKEAAWEFLKWITSDRVQYIYAMNLGTPVVFSVLRDPWLQHRFPWYKVILEAEESGDVDAQFRPRIPEWPQMEEAMGLVFNQVVLGEVPVEAALKKLNDEITAILTKSGRL